MCKYYRQYNDGKFSFPICTLHNDLAAAEEAVKYCNECDNNKKHIPNKKSIKKTFKKGAKAFKNLTKTTNKFTDALKKLNNKLNKEVINEKNN